MGAVFPREWGLALQGHGEENVLSIPWVNSRMSHGTE